MDKEYIVLEEINNNQNISQRQLARNTGLSLGSINILLKKMAKEGLIKIESIPANRVVYMLTPKGMLEKANKTYKYIKHHYGVIEETKKKIKSVLEKLLEENDSLSILLSEDEISELVKTSVEELDMKEKILLVNEKKEMDESRLLVTLNSGDYEACSDKCDKVVCLVERL
ncbi:MAG: winged helix-turn-helix transcriptional regulator [Clostridiaceae bacterium]|nr:winged helix-turn-helix transcriptional regulator [Clostridiaceae bacterium]